MGLFSSVADSVGGTFADQWKDIIVPVRFDQQAALVPGIRKNTQEGRGDNHGLSNILTNGSIIQVPEGTCALVISRSGIEQVIEAPGGYEYRNGQATILDADDRAEQGFVSILTDQIGQRFEYSGMSPDDKRVVYVNRREIRGIKFGTHGPLVYNDLYYGADLEVIGHGSFTIKVVDPVRFYSNFVPANSSCCNFEHFETRGQLVAELLQSLIVAINELSQNYRISQLPSQAARITDAIQNGSSNAGTWEDRFGLRLISAALEDIEFSKESRKLVKDYSKRKMDVSAYENISQRTANIAAQQEIAQGIHENGLGDAGGMILGTNIAGSINPGNASQVRDTSAPEARPQAGEPAPASAMPAAGILTLDEQIETLKKLKELLDADILTQDEFVAKKKQVLGL